ncbi:fatty acid synthase-like [Oppia nitens]|uniref:fatty acid synthase-like n=1 Tax=Oppia nitens TaxID=1686743 RepID=UPI0023DA1598|nr:fatty acid synthase-like [Oppia nitens]
MAKALMSIQVFADKVDECHQILSENFNIDLKWLLLSDDPQTVSTMTNKFCSKTSIEIALFELIKSLDITPDGIIGHSFGEIASAYADGCLTTREAMAVAYYRGVITASDRLIPKGLMVFAAVSKSEAQKLCSDGVYVVCNNAKDVIILSGPVKEMHETIDKLVNREVIVRQLKTNDIPYHSKYLQSSAQPMIDAIKKYLPEPKIRSNKWLSTSLLTEPHDDVLKYASAEYFVYNLLNPVEFYERLKQIPTDAVVLELSPHPIFNKIIAETLVNSTYISLLKNDTEDNNLDRFLTGVSKLYELGFNPSIEILYPKVEWPVARQTPSIASLHRWDHSEQFKRRLYPLTNCRLTASDMNVTVDINSKDWEFLADHCIDGNIIFPATNYLMLAWRHLAASVGKLWITVPVVFENIQFRRATLISANRPSHLKVRYFANNGDFVILEDDNIAVVGKMSSPPNNTEFLMCQHMIAEKNNHKVIATDEYLLERDDIRKELRVNGYDFGSHFRRLKSIRTKNFRNFLAINEWDGNFVTFLDSMLQSMLLSAPIRQMMVPVMVRSVKIDPTVFFDQLKRYRQSDSPPNKLINPTDDEQQNKFNLNHVDIDITATDILAERFHKYQAEVPIYYNRDIPVLVTHGIEIHEICTSAIPRKLDTQSTKLVLDSYEWMPNTDVMAIDVDYHYNSNDNRNIDTIKNNNKLMTIVADICNKPEFDINFDIINNIDNNERLLRTMIDIISENMIPVHELNVTEINLKNSGSSYLMDKIIPLMVNFKVMPTDVNYRIIFNKSGQQPRVPPLDIGYKYNIQEWDVNESIVLLSNHLIIMRDNCQLWDDSSSIVGCVDNFIQDMYDSIVTNGFLLAIFRYKLTEPEVAIKSLINPKNKCLTDKYLTDRIDTFHKIAVKLGFRFICSKFDTIGTQTILFRKSTDTPTVPINDSIVWIAGQQQYNLWFDTLKNKLNNISDGKVDTIWLISNNKDTNINGLLGFINCLRLEPNGHYFKCIINYENNNNIINANNTIDFTVEPYATILANNMAINIIRDGNIGTYRYMRLPKYFDTVISNNYFLNYGQNNVADISGLTWYDSNHIWHPKERYDFNNNKYTNVSVNVYCSGLIFKDVILASGRITAPIDILYSNNTSDLGCEFAGRRVDTGERVMGVGMGCIASVINTQSNWITTIPDHWSMEEAATVVANYSTLYYGLILKGNLQKGEKVLIHSGTGGIGQSAINICRHYDCDIYTTIGTEEKRQFLIKEYGLSDNKIFSSRDTLFKLKILELTEGKGVDICINSLTGDLLDASYQCIANGGRFLELGKVDMIQNKRLDMFDFLRDISFIGVAMDMALTKKVDLMPKFFQWMHQNSGFDGCVKPITKTVFTPTEAVQAFRYMTTGKHIGKIVIKFRKEEDYREPITIVKPSPDMLVIRKTYFNADKCYIITGGLGGYGLELIHWMIKKGAKNFIRALKVSIVVSTANGKTIDGSRQLLCEAEQLGPIGGVFHLALELNDCLLNKSKSLEKYRLAIDTKYLLFEHLDQLTRALTYKLDYFVVFSSLACGKGNAGQTNYSLGNSLCERICEQRNRDGLHGLAIQYGPIGDVGAVVNMESYVKHFATMQMQRINSCCHVLDKLLQTRQPIVTSYVINTYNKNLVTKGDRVIGKLWRALGIDPDTTPDNMSLGEIGMESMFVIEMQHEFQTRYGSQLSVQQIKRITVKMLKDYDTGNNNIIRQYMDQLKACKSHILCYRFQLPTDAWVRLNNNTQGKPVYLMPPPECNFAAFEQWTHKVNRPVIGLNWTRHMYQPSYTMKVVFEYYINLMENLEPNGNYDVVGYLDGAYIATQLVRKGKADRALIVDMFDEKMQNNNNNNDILNLIIDYYFNDIPECYYDKLQIDLKAIGDDLSKQIQRLVYELKELAGRQLVITDAEQILTIFHKRLDMLLTYLKDKSKKFGTNLDERVDKMWAKTTGKVVFLSSNTDDSETNLSTNDGHKSFIGDMYLLPNSSVS